MIDVLLRQSRGVIVSCEMRSEALVRRREPTPDMLDAPDPFAETQEVGHTTLAATGAYNACFYSDTACIVCFRGKIRNLFDQLSMVQIHGAGGR